MNSEIAFEFFVNSIFPLLVLIIGMPGNILGFKVLRSKKLKNIGPILIYKFLFVSDLIYLPQIIIVYMITGFNIDITILSSLGCKVYNYFNYFLDAFSPWLLVYISIEKFISIVYPEKRFVLRQNLHQFLYLLIIVLFALFYYIPQAFCWDVINVSETINETEVLQCVYINYELQQVSSYMDVIHRAILPFILMTLFSSLLIRYIFKAKNQIANLTADERKRFKRDVRFALSSFSMNLLFMALNMPLSVFELTPNFSVVSFNASLYLFYLSYGINFYVLIITNSIFRTEFIEIISQKKINQPDALANQNTLNIQKHAKKVGKNNFENTPKVFYSNGKDEIKINNKNF
jgi:hypothetical protein